MPTPPQSARPSAIRSALAVQGEAAEVSKASSFAESDPERRDHRARRIAHLLRQALDNR